LTPSSPEQQPAPGIRPRGVGHDSRAGRRTVALLITMAFTGRRGRIR
jgi:hypothetical protein